MLCSIMHEYACLIYLVMFAALGDIYLCLDRRMLGLGMICHVDCFRCMSVCVCVCVCVCVSLE